ncbi:rRNA maturation RNase YbeY [Cohnella fermenti]|uniref:Endoribonuclease YbeY n=1 Tax=Cohnella fermenti TaxID=2565925 RepID=A0A4S4BGC2_9BACL|nr:rRNA maturation RNase YbeY [Cohnella fermenti]THF72782.1 rRNA maturation RNase YbeY [Cohnella fermenti]
MTISLEWYDEREPAGGTNEAKDAGWQELLERLLKLAGEAEGVEAGVVSLTLTDDDGIRELNREHRGLDKPTDVLSFPMREPGASEPDIRYDDEYETVEYETETDAGEESEWEGDDGLAADGFDPFAEMLGDIVISVPRMYEQAEEYGHSPERELGFLFVHGFLHLMGYDHMTEEEEKAMIAKQEAVLSRAGLSR